MLSVGIDFGTTTTVAAAYREGRTTILTNELGEELTPSCVAFPPTGEIAVGSAAKRRRAVDPNNSLYSVKRILGQPAHHSSVREFREHYPFMLESTQDNQPALVTRAGKFTPTDIASMLLSSVRRWPALQREDIANCTLTVPAAFSDSQRDALKLAALQAGFERVEVIDEPRAAALAYLEGDESEQVVVVYDLGGGTFDITIIKWGGDEYQVIGVGGDTYSDYTILGAGGDGYLGGDDVDLSCANYICQEVLRRHRWDIKTSATAFQRLLFSCETAKQLLSLTNEQSIDLSAVDVALKKESFALTREDVQRLCRELVQRTFIICDEALAQAGVTPDAISTVLLSGGSCHMPMIQSGVESYFKKKPKVAVQPDRAVAVGAARHAGREW